MKKLFLCFLLASCSYYNQDEGVKLVSIQVQDRNGLTETINVEEKLSQYETVDFLASQPYRKVTRVYRNQGKQEAYITTYHPNGQPKQYLEAKEMRANGLFKEWHPNGRLKIEANLIGGTADLGVNPPNDWLFNGIAKAWSDTGVLLAEIDYEKGLLEGESKTFLENGELKSKSEYQKGLKQGQTLTFYSTKTPSSIEKFENDLLMDGIYYNLQGDLISSVSGGVGFQIIFEENRIRQKNEIQNGICEGVVEFYDRSGNVESRHELKAGKKNGDELVFYPGAKQLKLSIAWLEDLISGRSKTWYPDGSLESQREYAENDKNGPSIGWYRDGSLMFVEEYEKGKLISGKYFKKGKKEPISVVANGSGTATLFDEWGRFPKKIRYTKGIPSEPDDLS